MEKTENLSVREFIEYAEENGYNSTFFSLKRAGSHVCVGKVLDIYYEFVQIPILGTGFVRISDLEDQLGHDISFDVIDQEKYDIGVKLDFILRGKQVPKEYE